MDTEDQRDVEISTLSAIFPEIKRLAEDDPYTFTLDVPVSPAKTVTVYFPAAESGQVPNPTAPQILPGTAPRPAWIDSHELSHLPAVRLQISLPESYPTEQPPVVNVSTTPPWLPSSSAKIVEDHCARLWEELGRDLVVFAYIDLVQQLADAVFGLVSDTGALEIRPEHKIAVLDFDMGAKKAAFDRETFDCGVCLGKLILIFPDLFQTISLFYTSGQSRMSRTRIVASTDDWRHQVESSTACQLLGSQPAKHSGKCGYRRVSGWKTAMPFPLN